MARGSNDKANHHQQHHLTVTGPSSQQSRVTGSGSGSGSGHRSSSDPGAVVHCSGTLNSFNNHDKGSQNFHNAKINSGNNSGRPILNQASVSDSAETSTRSLNQNCSGTLSSFNCYGNGSHNFEGGKINSGENSGNRGERSSSVASEQQRRVLVSGTPDSSEQQLRASVTGTVDSFNNYGKLRSNFKGAEINSGENSGKY